VRTLFLKASRSSWLERQARRRGFTRRAVHRFMPGETLEKALDAADELEERGIPCVLTQLGENVETERDADQVVVHYRSVLDAVRFRDLDVQLSVKPTHLGMDLGLDGTVRRVGWLLETAEASGIPLWIDMEDSSYVDRTLELFLELLPGRRDFGICLQAYLHRTGADMDRVLEAGGAVRLVKGAYRESPDVAIRGKRKVDDAYRTLAGRLLDHAETRNDGVLHVLGTHDLALLESLVGPLRGSRDVAIPGAEVQMLYGIRTRDWPRLQAAGVPLRILISYGERWFPWYMRRLAERPTNALFVLRSLMPGTT
jgi:proline dehydrogenase